MTRDEEIRSIKEKLDYYTMENDDEKFDVEERLDELEPIPLLWRSVDEVLKDFWKYFYKRQREEWMKVEIIK